MIDINSNLKPKPGKKGFRPSDVVREALEERMRQRTARENCRELAQRLGVIGYAKGLPADLSTNPGHAEWGFR